MKPALTAVKQYLDASDERGRGDVERGVVDGDAFRGRLASQAVGDLARIALLDGDRGAIGKREVEGARGGSHVEGKTVRAGEQRKTLLTIGQAQKSARGVALEAAAGEHPRHLRRLPRRDRT